MMLTVNLKPWMRAHNGRTPTPNPHTVEQLQIYYSKRSTTELGTSTPRAASTPRQKGVNPRTRRRPKPRGVIQWLESAQRQWKRAPQQPIRKRLFKVAMPADHGINMAKPDFREEGWTRIHPSPFSWRCFPNTKLRREKTKENRGPPTPNNQTLKEKQKTQKQKKQKKQNQKKNQKTNTNTKKKKTHHAQTKKKHKKNTQKNKTQKQNKKKTKNTHPQKPKEEKEKVWVQSPMTRYSIYSHCSEGNAIESKYTRTRLSTEWTV